jgi:hypothetical protein
MPHHLNINARNVFRVSWTVACIDNSQKRGKKNMCTGAGALCVAYDATISR